MNHRRRFRHFPYFVIEGTPETVTIDEIRTAARRVLAAHGGSLWATTEEFAELIKLELRKRPATPQHTSILAGPWPLP